MLKFDFLALRYLTIIAEAEKQIKEKHPDFDVSKLSLDDKKTYELISKGVTDGVFQLESPGMRQMLTQLRPESIDDVIAAIALYRPGPMDSIPKYIEARHSGVSPTYKIPQLKPILDVTYGCIVYQEQVMRIFRDVAGYSLGHADIVRRAISKKKTEVLLSEKEAFINGAAERGVNREDAVDLFNDTVRKRMKYIAQRFPHTSGKPITPIQKINPPQVITRIPQNLSASIPTNNWQME